jgi:hypothetical protein
MNSVVLPNASLSSSQTPSMEPTPMAGGKRRVLKKATKEAPKKTSSKDASKKVSSSKKPKQQNAQDNSKKEKSKRGGAFVDDVKNLAVPFAILLAKEGLSKMFKDDKKNAKKDVSSKTASKPSSTRRRSTLSGGTCNLGCNAMTGGQAAKELFQLQKEIDNFLEKY